MPKLYLSNFVDIFSYSGPSEILGSDGKQNTSLVKLSLPFSNIVRPLYF